MTSGYLTTHSRSDRTRTRTARVIAWLSLATSVVTLAPSVARAQELAPVPAEDTPGSPSGSGVQPEVYLGNQTCQDLGYDFEFKVDPPTSGTYSIPGLPGSQSVTVTFDGLYVDWSSTLGIDAVLVKGGTNGNEYVYDPKATSDTDLHSPINPNNNEPYGISHVSFCINWEVEVGKTVATGFTRTYEWSVDKTSDVTQLTLSTGQTYDVSYDVVADIDNYTDADYFIEGTITIFNPAPFAAIIDSVTDELSSDGAAVVDCGEGVSFPGYSLASGATLECDYALENLASGTDQTNTATVTAGAASQVDGSSATEDVVFGSDPTSETDECADFTDDQYGALGTVCADDTLPHTFTYQITVGPYTACGDFQFVNEASFETNDTGATGSDTWTIDISVPCGIGCTLTPGYWKTHSELGPAAHPDDTWDLILPDAQDSPFFSSGQSYYEVLWTAPQGNAYYILAHAYIAAVLNGLNGANVPADVASALSQAQTFFGSHGPGDALNGSQRRQVIQLAALLDNYNNGLIGPGHCDEDGS